MKITVGVVGLGLIGASFCKAYKANEPEAVVYGWNRTKSTTEMAKMQGIIDDELTDENLGSCDLVILSLYPEASVKWMEEHRSKFNKNGMVTDACGTKRFICDKAFKIAGMAYSKADMYEGAPMVVVPPRFDDITLLEEVKRLFAPCGFGSFHIAHADEHDQMIAFTSQMPHVVSNAFIKSPNSRKHTGFSAGSYKDMTRVAWLNPTMWTQLFLENKDNLIFEIENLQKELQKYKEALENDDAEELTRLLDEGRKIKEEVDGV